VRKQPRRRWNYHLLPLDRQLRFAIQDSLRADAIFRLLFPNYYMPAAGEGLTQR
jgi:hypothetical protein